MSAKNDTISQALIDMENIKKSIKEESKNTLKSMLAEAVKVAIRESIEDETDSNDDDLQIINGEESTENNENDLDKNPESSTTVDNNSDGQEDSTEENGEEDTNSNAADTAETEENPDDKEEGTEDDGWSEYSDYKVGDDTYDLTGEKDFDKVLKAYKKLKDDEEVIVKKDGNNITLSDNETGAEYVIQLNDDSTEDSSNELSEANAINEEEFDDFGNDSFNEFDDDFDLSDNSEISDESDEDIAGIPNISEKCNKKMAKKERIFEIDLGYTDNYQDKDPISGLSNTEPSKSGKSWDKGLPTGTSKPWAGKTKDKGTPFEKTVSECGDAVKETAVDEGTNVTLPNSRKKTKSHTPDTEKKNYPKVHHHDSVAGNYSAMNEALKKENDMLKTEIKKFKEAIATLKDNLNEAYVTNVNLGKITKLFLENTTSKKEKIDIVNRFSNEAKTVEDSTKLYESINKELNNRKVSNPAPVTKIVTENKTKKEEYKSQDLIETIDLMNRVLNC